MQPSMKPNTEWMLGHLEHLFGGFLDGCHDGLIEIAWTDAADQKLKHARLFGTDQIEEAAEFAHDQNRISGQNVYVGAGLRKPGTPKDRRAADGDILALTAFYTDLDENDAAHQAKDRYNDCPPNVVRQPDVAACIEFIKKNGIKVFIVDPFVETHNVEENSNEQIKEVAMLYREIARQGDCAVLLVHHTSKPQQASSDGYAGNMNTARGASSLLGVARVVQTLYGMSSRDAEKHGIKDEERHLYVRLDDAKANLSLASTDAKWFERIGIIIANGDEVGVLNPVMLEPITTPDSQKKEFYKTLITALLKYTTERHQTVNAAAKDLAWSEDERFHKYRETDKNGYRRAARYLRANITDACRANITITTEKGNEGFTLEQQITPASLKRFCTALNPLSQPEFMEDEHETID